MENSSIVSIEILGIIRTLQGLESLSAFALAGGTSLAIRFNHRYSYDIDFFTDKTIGREGLIRISQELDVVYKSALLGSEIINAESGDQFCFLRAFIATENGNGLKIEILQNMAILYPVEFYNKIRILSVRDIGLFKLMSASNRKAKKDIYDLDFITDEITLPDLLRELQEKHDRFCEDKHKCLFDLDNEESPNKNLALLLEFDKTDYRKKDHRPHHSTDAIDTALGSKSWHEARTSWLKKVKGVMGERGIAVPPVKPIN
jgi:predicted nucleotidyltransferase component of viral defense system